MTDDANPAGSSSEFRETLRILKKDPQEAVALLRGRIADGTADYRTWHNLAVALGNSGNLPGALEAVRTALDAAPDSIPSRFLLGMLLRDADRFADALEAFAEVEKAEPGFPRLHAARGVVHFFLEDGHAALGDFEEAHRRDPKDVVTLFNLAVVNVSLKRFEAARHTFGNLIELEPGRSGYYQAFLVELGRVQVVEETLTQAHRIKNFMGIVGDRLRTFCEGEIPGLADDAQEDLAAIREDYERIYSDLVVFLRAIRPRPMRLEKVHLTRLLDTVIFVAIDKGEGIRLEKEFADGLPEITCDIELLQEAFLNLVLNALDAVRARGEGRDGDGCVQLLAEPSGAGILISFVDNGAGIASGDLARVFNFGFTTKTLGTGIGLSFTRKILEDHGGSIEMESTEGEGTTVHCFLPVTPRVTENLTNLALRSQLLADPRELILEEGGEDLGI